jgi:thymidine phosphorylase
MSEATSKSAAGGGDVATVRNDLRRRWEAGEAIERLEQMISAQGGDARVCSDPAAVLPTAPVTRDVVATSAGRVCAMPARGIGEIVARLGAGRARKGDDVDPAVGLRLEVEVGDEISEGQRLAVVHARSEHDAEQAVTAMQAAIQLGDDVQQRDVVISRVLLG